MRFSSDCPYLNPPEELHSLVELYDSYGRPFLLVPLEVAQRRKLARRVIFVCLRDVKGRYFLRRRSKADNRHPGLWDLSVTGSVLAGESLEGAAFRELEQGIGLSGIPVKSIASLPYAARDGEHLSGTFFLAGPTPLKPCLRNGSDGMFVDADEVRGFVTHQEDMVTPELAWAVRTGWIAPTKPRPLGA